MPSSHDSPLPTLHGSLAGLGHSTHSFINLDVSHLPATCPLQTELRKVLQKLFDTFSYHQLKICKEMIDFFAKPWLFLSFFPMHKDDKSYIYLIRSLFKLWLCWNGASLFHYHGEKALCYFYNSRKWDWLNFIVTNVRSISCVLRNSEKPENTLYLEFFLFSLKYMQLNKLRSWSTEI